MLQEVLLPKLGQTMEEATIERWIKNEGDTVKRGDVLLEITTDKATLEVESFVDGKLLKILGKDGDVLPVNAVLAYVGEDGDEIPAAAPAAPKAAPAAKPAGDVPDQAEPAPAAAAPASQAAPAARPAGRIFASPRARALAKAKEAPLEAIRGTGPNGRIVEKDVKAWLERGSSVSATPTARRIAAQSAVDITTIAGSGPGGRTVKQDVLGAAPCAPAAGEKPSAMRRIVAERMSLSKRESPHFYLDFNVDMTVTVAYRTALNSGRERKISFNDILAKGCAACIKAVPQINTVWADGQVVRKSDINISLAIALDEGLMVPVVRNVDRKSLDDISADTRDLIEKARSKRLLPEECEGGSMTISNMGMFGVNSFYPVINPGESCIIGVGAIVDTPVVRGGGICVRKMMNLSMSCDHRVVDGAVAAKFVSLLKNYLETLEPPIVA